MNDHKSRSKSKKRCRDQTHMCHLKLSMTPSHSATLPPQISSIEKSRTRHCTAPHRLHSWTKRAYYMTSSLVQRDLHLKCFKKRKASELPEASKQLRLKCAKALYKQYPPSLVNFIFFTDEKFFTVARPSNSQKWSCLRCCWCHEKEHHCSTFAAHLSAPVSYTHLTLPTIYSV